MRNQTVSSRIAVALALVSIASACGDGSDGAGSAEPSVEGVVEFAVPSRGHVRTRVAYAQTPPVGGDHASVWQTCGIYAAPIFPETAVHSLEHGAVWITYAPDVGDDQIASLSQLMEDRTYVLVSPFDDLPAPIVASAWGVQLLLDDPADPALVEFVDRYAQGPQSPEPGAPCTNGYDEPA